MKKQWVKESGCYRCNACKKTRNTLIGIQRHIAKEHKKKGK